MDNEVKNLARSRMKGHCKVCPTCNGKVCAGEVPGMGGLGTGASFHNNFEALAAVKLNMTALHEIKTPTTNTNFLGMELATPVMAAPIGGVPFNMTSEVTEDDYIEYVLGGCEMAGTLGCTGDGVPPFIVNAAVKAMGRHKGIPFVKPWEGKELYEKLERVLACKPAAVGMDVDAAGLVTLRKMGRPVTPMSHAELSAAVDFAHKKGFPFIVKGIMTPRDAMKAVRAGADAIVVSNHGGRILDHCPGAAAVLEGIAKTVSGSVTIIADGAVRTGVDVLKLLALGADACFVGRPVCVAAIGGGIEGVRDYFKEITQELSQAMLLTGVGSIADISSDIIFRG